jgi:hypothetical protein
MIIVDSVIPASLYVIPACRESFLCEDITGTIPDKPERQDKDTPFHRLSFPLSFERESRKYKAGFRLKNCRNDGIIEA